MDKCGFPPRPSTAAEMANILLSNRGSSHTTKRIGKNWVSTFIQRHPKLKTCFSRRYNYQRAKCKDQTIISKWFDQVKQVIQDYRILTEDIYNFDETGFVIGLIVTAKVITNAETNSRLSLI